MASITSSSTLPEIRAEYLETASYEEDGDVSKARRFITACRALLVMLPASAMHQNLSQFSFSIEQITAELKAAQRYVAAASTTSGAVRHADFTDFR